MTNEERRRVIPLAMRAALADNPFIKGEGMSPRARREMLGHSQLALSL